MRCLQQPARLVQEHSVNVGSGNPLSYTENSDTGLKVEMLPPEALQAYPGNARTHSKNQIRWLGRSPTSHRPHPEITS
jgi:hypothetical protein